MTSWKIYLPIVPQKEHTKQTHKLSIYTIMKKKYCCFGDFTYQSVASNLDLYLPLDMFMFYFLYQYFRHSSHNFIFW